MRTVTDSKGVEYAHTNVLIPLETHQKARSLKINMSQICTIALRDQVTAIEAQMV